MSNTEIKASIDQMTDEERFFAVAYLQHLAEQKDPAYQALLAQRMQRMDAGRKLTLEQAQRIHQSLEAEGI
ncbi:MAG: hypothetical protein H0X66_14875 [Verrucomicrobia bacterium]|nr:hypothetical protein [Verrucomicrobiota bacterium]